jgi:uncharacterized membrane protein
MRKILLMLVFLAFAFTCASSLFAVGDSGSTATVIKIEGNRITLKDDQGLISTIMNDPTGLRVGETVRLQNGRIVRVASNLSSAQTVKPGELNPGERVGINPQPEPPGKNR